MEEKEQPVFSSVWDGFGNAIFEPRVENKWNNVVKTYNINDLPQDDPIRIHLEKL
jgi:hypothetical protein